MRGNSRNGHIHPSWFRRREPRFGDEGPTGPANGDEERSGCLVLVLIILASWLIIGGVVWAVFFR